MLIEFSENKKNLVLALLEFNRKVEPIFRKQTASIKTKSGGEMRYKFSDLASIQSEINGILSECGLVVIQSPVGHFQLETVIIHAESGEYVSGCYEMVPAGNTPQQQGSTITYQKRYALVAMLNLIVKDDDDAKKGSQKTSEEQQAGKPFKKSSKELEDDYKKEDFFPKLYQAERACLKNTGAFTLRDFLANYYEYTTTVIVKIEDDYFEYKTSKQLP